MLMLMFEKLFFLKFLTAINFNKLQRKSTNASVGVIGCLSRIGDQ